MNRTKIILHVLQSRKTSDPIIIPVSPDGISGSNVILEMVNSVVLLALSLTNDEIITHGPLCHCLSFSTVQLDSFTSCHATND